MAKWKVVGLAAFLGLAGASAWLASPGADAGGIKNPFACARNPKCVELYPTMKKMVAEPRKQIEDIRNPFAECELVDPFKPDPLCDQVRAARAETQARAAR